jgi:hypothetical protein
MNPEKLPCEFREEMDEIEDCAEYSVPYVEFEDIEFVKGPCG